MDDPHGVHDAGVQVMHHGKPCHQDRQCPRCTLKHLGQAKACAKLARLLLAEARVLGFESLKGYPHHYWDALGHMAQAEDEVLVVLPEVAGAIRDARKAWELDVNALPDFRALMYAVNDGAGLGFKPREIKGQQQLWETK